MKQHTFEASNTAICWTPLRAYGQRDAAKRS
ncbi:hypothetical protein ACVWW4_002753 [Bradyrhizobium sp. LB7.1]